MRDFLQDELYTSSFVRQGHTHARRWHKSNLVSFFACAEGSMSFSLFSFAPPFDFGSLNPGIRFQNQSRPEVVLLPN